MKRTIGRGRATGALAILIAVSGVTAACGTSSQSSASTPAAPKTWSVVALGDSVPRGTNCECRPYPPLSADGLAATIGQTVTATNDSVAGYTTSGVLRQLESDGAVIDHIRAARAVEIEVGANDVAYSRRCGTSVECYAPLVPPVERNLTAIVRRVRELSSGHRALVVLLDYWSIWLGGKYAAEKGDAYVNAAREMTDQVNAAIKSTATESGSAYVDLRRAFKGPNYAYDETHYLSSDGDHPNAAGHEAIARATETVIEKALHL